MGGFRMKKVVLSLILALSAGLVLVSKPQASTSQSAVLFLRIAAGARAAGMGEAFVAVADDATATHWNPAGLGLYPLTSTWLEYPMNAPVALKALALTRNDIPDNNYRRFDVWGITNTDLYKWDGISWKNWDNYKLSGVQGIADLLKQITGVQEEEKLTLLQEQVATFNSGISKED